LSGGEILDAGAEAKAPDEWIDRVEDLLLGSQSAEYENYTFAAIFVDKAYRNAEKNKKLLKLALAIGIPLLAVGIALGITGIVRHNIRQGKITELTAHRLDAESAVEAQNFVRAAKETESAYALALELALEQEQADMRNLSAVLELIIAGDASFSDGMMDRAYEQFEQARLKSKDADLRAMPYIDSQSRLIYQHLEIADLLDSGEKHLDAADADAAESSFVQARTLAARLFARDERTRAQDGLDKTRELRESRRISDLTEKAKEHEASGDGDPASALQSYQLAMQFYREAGDTANATIVQAKIDSLKTEQTVQEQSNLLAEAQTTEQLGDAAFRAGDYESAKTHFLDAQDAYIRLGMSELSLAVGQKVISVFDEERSANESLAKAVTYEKDGDICFLNAEPLSAEILYRMSRDIYAQLGMLEAAAKIDEKLEKILGSSPPTDDAQDEEAVGTPDDRTEPAETPQTTAVG
jgi:predicted lipid-binding transport protein (Tim44 family)